MIYITKFLLILSVSIFSVKCDYNYDYENNEYGVSQNSSSNNLTRLKPNCVQSGCRENSTDSTKHEIEIIYTDDYEIKQIKLNEHFSSVINSKIIESDLSVPTELYYNSKSDYIIYENIRNFFKKPLHESQNRVSTQLKVSLKLNSQLNIDWIHNLFYWIKNENSIVVANVTKLNNQIVVAKKIHDFIKHLSINPIASFIIWFEFDSENNINILFKSSQDGSDKREIFTTKSLTIKGLTIDFQSKRIYYLTPYELCSIDYNGLDYKEFPTDSLHIYQFYVLGDFIYWIEHNEYHFFRANITSIQSTIKRVELNQIVNGFQIIDYWRQPNGVDNCLASNCPDICLPIDLNKFRCVCGKNNCENSLKSTQNYRNTQSLSTKFERITNSTTISPISTTINITELHPNLYKDNSTKDSYSGTELNFTQYFAYNHDLKYNSEENNTNNNSNYRVNNYSSTLMTAKEAIKPTTDTTESEINVFNNTTKEYHSTTEQEVNNNREYNSQVYENDSMTTLFNISLNKTDNTLQNSNESVIIIDELKQFEHKFISWYNLIIYGISIFIIGILFGSIISAITIRIYGKQKCQINYNSKENMKWNYVGFKKAEGNIYFNEKYTVKDESLY